MKWVCRECLREDDEFQYEGEDIERKVQKTTWAQEYDDAGNVTLTRGCGRCGIPKRVYLVEEGESIDTGPTIIEEATEEDKISPVLNVIEAESVTSDTMIGDLSLEGESVPEDSTAVEMEIAYCNTHNMPYDVGGECQECAIQPKIDVPQPDTAEKSIEDMTEAELRAKLAELKKKAEE